MAAAASAAMAVPFVAAGTAVAQAAGTDPVTVDVRAGDITAAAGNRNGLTMKGFGILSGNSTSSLLMDYKAEHPDAYWELVNTLFGGDHPIIDTIKIEMGNDRNTSTGPDPATMRSRDEYPNVQREPGFQLAADADRVAKRPVHVSLLRWQRPTWVKNDQDQYIWFKNTAIAAYREYGFMVDSINPDTNETGNPNEKLYIDFSRWVQEDSKGYEGATADDPNNGWRSDAEEKAWKSVRTIGGDTVGTPPTDFGDQIVDNTDGLADALDIVGFHYASADDSHGNMTTIAEKLDKEVWNSEGQATFSNSADRPNNTMNASSGSGNGSAGNSGTELGGTNSALEMANWVTTGFSKSRRTMTVFQPAIGSFYDGFQYSAKELLSARDPWSGWIYYDAGLAAAEHFTQFATMGWENADNTAGIWRGIPQASGSDLGGGNPPSGARDGNKSYLTMAAPDASDFSTVIVNDSRYAKEYTIRADSDLLKALGDDRTMELWETRAADSGDYASNYLRPIRELTPNGDGSYTFTVAPWSMVTATTLDHAEDRDGALTARDGYGLTAPVSREYTADGGGRDVLDTDATGKRNGVTDDGYLYADDFDYRDEGNVTTWTDGRPVDSGESYLDSRGAKAKPAGTPNADPEDAGATPRYTDDTNGAFESVDMGDQTHGRVLRQQVGPGMDGGAWNSGDPLTTIGDMRWANYRVSADVLFEPCAQGGRYATIGARQQTGTANGQNTAAATLRVDTAGAWQLQRYGSVVRSGSAPAEAHWKSGDNQWNTIAVQVAGDTYTAYLNGVKVAEYHDATPQATGRIQLGSAFRFTQFDNLTVETVPGYAPYYTDFIDGMHQTSWDDVTKPVLSYNDRWQHLNGKGMFEYQRTSSTSIGAGATLDYTFTGTGVDLMGSNDGTARLDVAVDGRTIASGVPAIKAGNTGTELMVRGLADGTHTIRFTTVSGGAINVDAVGVIRPVGSVQAGDVDTARLKTAADTAAALDPDEWNAESWKPLQANLDAARQALGDPQAYGLDQEGADALAARLDAAVTALVPKDLSADVKDLGVLAVEAGAALPDRVTIDGAEHPAVWDAGMADAAAALGELGSATLTGRTGDRIDGVVQRFSVTLFAAPAGLRYFIDSGAVDAGQDGSSVYGAVKASVPDLLNDAADQTWDGQAAGRTWGYSTSATARENGDPKDWSSSYLGVDYNKPIDYHLTLPAGHYEVVTVQAPRQGMTTRLYQTVRAPGQDDSRVTAVSDGSATPIRQQLTLDSQGVVTVEFGTDGTSGYNGRLALTYVVSVPVDLGVVAAVRAKDGVSLPATVRHDGADVAVTWDDASKEAAAKAVDYATVDVTGVARISGVSQKVTARIEVIPDGLEYYIDSGTGGVASPQYTAVKAAVPGLRNDTVDRSSDGSAWGYDPTGVKIKGSTDINDKYSTGLYQDTEVQTYYLPLDAGTYTLTAGFTEWWGMSRSMNATVTVDGTELARGNIPLSGSNTPLTGVLSFTLDRPATAVYQVTNRGAGGEKPVISWLAVARQADEPEPEPEPVMRTVTFDANGGTLADGTAISQTSVRDGGKVARPTDPTRDGYSFDGWTVGKDGTEAYDFDAPVTGDLTLVAQWTENEPEPEPVDRTELATAVATATLGDTSDCTDESVKAAQAALAAARTAAQTVLDDQDATQADIDAALTAFRAAVEEAKGLLVRQEAPGPDQPDQPGGSDEPGNPDEPDRPGTPDMSKLQQAVTAADALDGKGYTPESYNALVAAVDAAKRVLADPDATQAEVDAALADLNRARAALESAPGVEAGTGSSSGADDDREPALSRTGSAVTLAVALALVAGAAGTALAFARRRRA